MLVYHKTNLNLIIFFVVPIFQLVAETNFTEESNTIVQLCVELVQSTLTFPIDVLVQDGTQMATLFGIFFPDNRLATSKHT